MKKTSQRSLLFRQNVGRTEEEWAHFLDGYRQALSLRLASTSGRGGRGGDEGLARTRCGDDADLFAMCLRFPLIAICDFHKYLFAFSSGRCLRFPQELLYNTTCKLHTKEYMQ